MCGVVACVGRWRARKQQGENKKVIRSFSSALPGSQRDSRADRARARDNPHRPRPVSPKKYSSSLNEPGDLTRDPSSKPAWRPVGRKRSKAFDSKVIPLV